MPTTQAPDETASSTSAPSPPSTSPEPTTTTTEPATTPGVVDRSSLFKELRGDELNPVAVEPAPADKGVGGEVHRLHDYGATFHDTAVLTPDGGTVPADGLATGQVFSSADGVTYWAGAEAPAGNTNLPDDPIGSTTKLTQEQSFIKRADDASLTFTVTSAYIETTDLNSPLNRVCPGEHVEFDALGAVCDLIKGQLILDVTARTPVVDDPDDPDGFGTSTLLWESGAGLTLNGYAGNWEAAAWNGASPREPVWDLADFDLEFEALDGDPEGLVRLTLREPITMTVDLSAVDVGDTFTLTTLLQAEAYNRIAGPPSEFGSSASAFLRDPQEVGGTTLTFSGLEPADNVDLGTIVETPSDPAPCPSGSPDPAAGLLAFSATTYALGEANSTPAITVTRSGGDTGAVTATITTQDGTAIADSDYTPLHRTVHFADGDTSPRLVELPILNDLEQDEPDETVTIALTDPGGCATLGSIDTTTLTIRDNDRPVVDDPAFSIGGTVTGLDGSGLVLTSLGERLTPGNGPFAFTEVLPDGFPYIVRVSSQPSDPNQLCTVTNGVGTIDGADVTDVAVTCTTLPTIDGLDPTFGGGDGIVTTPGVEAAQAIVVQPDGKIVAASDNALTRYHPNGALDATFGDGGVAATSIDADNCFPSDANDLAVQADGKIVVVGVIQDDVLDENIGIQRYDTNGELDTGFGDQGTVSTDIGGGRDCAFAVAIANDADIVVAGGGNGVDVVVARYDPRGSPDTSFGSGATGHVLTDVGGELDAAADLAIDADGNAVVLARVAEDSSLDHFAVLRYTPAGVLDPTFDGDGITDIAPGNPQGMDIDADGRIVIAGSFQSGFSTGKMDLALWRLTASGEPDPSLSSDGFVTTDFAAAVGPLSQDDSGRGVAVHTDGTITVVGTAHDDLAIARYDTDGTAAIDFGDGGRSTIDIRGGFDAANDVTILTNGNILLAGTAANGTSANQALVRLLP